jgi:tetratricopeptide (TPR) repeat protein
MPLTATDLITLSRLLDEALDMEPAQAEAWLAALPKEHAHLRPKLQEMLAAHQADSEPDFMADGPKLAALPDETIPRVDELIGPYRLIREIGHGGMGTVWLAERADGTLKRQVALKLPRLAWGAGLADRMARERDIGALLEHPNIARLYDAGVDAKGRPYLALEYIAGHHINSYCDAHGLGVTERLRLFVQVARAVAYAHGRLVVHRDLKPSNVLVADDGQAYLLDFGIAKLLHEAADATQLTQEQGRVLTPQYASPEQVRGETITVVSDVYSLGVLLYQLLSSSLPYQLKRQTLGAIEQAILENEPPLASSRVVEKRRVAALRGELDAILAKALRREPARRYQTVEALADDIERHLAGERVLAQPDSLGYRAAKAWRRHRVGLAAAAAVLLAVLSGASVSLVQARRANESAERARVVKEFVVDVFKVNSSAGTNNAELRKLPARMLLDRGAKLIEQRFAGQPSLQSELYSVVGGIFLDMGAPEVAEQYATKQVATLATTDAGRLEQASALLLLAQAHFDLKRYQDAELRIRRAMVLADDDPALKVHSQLMLANVLERLGRVTECEGVLTSVEATLRNSAREPSVDRALAMKLRATLLTNANHFDEAISLLRGATDEALAAEGVLSRTAVDIRLGLAREFVKRFRLDDSRAPMDAALGALRALGGASLVRASIEEAQLTTYAYENQLLKFNEARSVVQRDRNQIAEPDNAAPDSVLAKVDLYLGWLELSWGNVAEAGRIVSHAAAGLQPEVDALSDRYQLTLGLAAVNSMAGKHDLADVQFRALARLQQQMGHSSSPFSAEDYAAIAENLGMWGQYQLGLDLLASAPKYERVQGMAPDGERTEALIDGARARLLLQSGDPLSALQALPDEPMTAFTDGYRRIRGESLCVSGRPEEGLQTLLSVIEFFAPIRYEYDPVLARDRAVAGLCALAARKRPLAETLASLSREALRAQPGVSSYFKEPLRRLEQKLAH